MMPRAAAAHRSSQRMTVRATPRHAARTGDAADAVHAVEAGHHRAAAVALDDQVLGKQFGVFHQPDLLHVCVLGNDFSADHRWRDDGLTGTEARAVIGQFVARVLAGDAVAQAPVTPSL